MTEKEAAAIFQSREQFIKYPFKKYGIPVSAVHSNLLPSNNPTEDRWVKLLLPWIIKGFCKWIDEKGFFEVEIKKTYYIFKAICLMKLNHPDVN